MIAEAIDHLTRLADAARKPHIVHVPGEPPHVVHVALPDGGLERIEVTPGYRLLELERLDDLIALGKSHFDADVRGSRRMLVVYHAGGVVLVFDHKNGYEQATVKLRATDEWGFFSDRRLKPVISPKELRDALRYDLRKTYSDARLIDQVSKLGFKMTDANSVAVDRGRESLGRAINELVQEPDDLPDPYQTFNVRKYRNPDLAVRFPILCALDPDTHTRQWLLKPLEDSWIDFEDAQLQVVGDRLREAFKDTGVPVYQGTYEQAKPGVELEA